MHGDMAEIKTGGQKDWDTNKNDGGMRSVPAHWEYEGLPWVNVAYFAADRKPIIAMISLIFLGANYCKMK